MREEFGVGYCNFSSLSDTSIDLGSYRMTVVGLKVDAVREIVNGSWLDDGNTKENFDKGKVAANGDLLQAC